MTYLHVELLQFLLLACFSRRSFCERRNPLNNMDPLSGTDVIQTESPENFVVIFELLPIHGLTRNERATKLRIADLKRVVALTTGMLLFKLIFFTHRLHSNSNSSTVFCFTKQNSNSVSFSQSAL